jgi:hypothetical protein
MTWPPKAGAFIKCGAHGRRHTLISGDLCCMSFLQTLYTFTDLLHRGKQISAIREITLTETETELASLLRLLLLFLQFLRLAPQTRHIIHALCHPKIHTHNLSALVLLQSLRPRLLPTIRRSWSMDKCTCTVQSMSRRSYRRA